MSQTNHHSPTPDRCPYCKKRYGHLPPHIRACDAVPTTDEVLDA
jgi:hypothetical protein